MFLGNELTVVANHRNRYHWIYVTFDLMGNLVIKTTSVIKIHSHLGTKTRSWICFKQSAITDLFRYLELKIRLFDTHPMLISFHFRFCFFFVFFDIPGLEQFRFFGDFQLHNATFDKGFNHKTYQYKNGNVSHVEYINVFQT